MSSPTYAASPAASSSATSTTPVPPPPPAWRNASARGISATAAQRSQPLQHVGRRAQIDLCHERADVLSIRLADRYGQRDRRFPEARVPVRVAHEGITRPEAVQPVLRELHTAHPATAVRHEPAAPVDDQQRVAVRAALAHRVE